VALLSAVGVHLVMRQTFSGWFFAGVLVFSAGLGLLVGSSNSPVAGVAISSLFGLLLTLYTIIPKKGKEGNEVRPVNVFSFIGQSLVLFTLGLIGGCWLGVQYRLGTAEPNAPKAFLWEGTRPPSSTYEALDWLSVQDILVSKGYTVEQVRLLYQMRAKEMTDTATDEEKKYSTDRPYFKMLPAVVTPDKKGRGPASVDGGQ